MSLHKWFNVTVLKASWKTAKTKPIGLVKEIVLIDSHPKAAEKIQMASNARQKKSKVVKNGDEWVFVRFYAGGVRGISTFPSFCTLRTFIQTKVYCRNELTG